MIGIDWFIFSDTVQIYEDSNIVPDITLKEGDFIGGLVIYSPGHTEGSISLYNEDSVLFSGDAL